MAASVSFDDVTGQSVDCHQVLDDGAVIVGRDSSGKALTVEVTRLSTSPDDLPETKAVVDAGDARLKQALPSIMRTWSEANHSLSQSSMGERQQVLQPTRWESEWTAAQN